MNMCVGEQAHAMSCVSESKHTCAVACERPLLSVLVYVSVSVSE